ncbi:MAG TPA: phosphate starvation-inducible protein PhoH, partial [Chryseolinea sp.]|nr:phosphate starvation-inducible protein PhoH [Chryseolinea sp.]
MIEKIVQLDNISLIDFLGIENKTIDTLSAAFPKSKIVSRGNELLIKGPTDEIKLIDDILNSLIDHYHQFGKVTEENVKNYLYSEDEISHPDIS